MGSVVGLVGGSARCGLVGESEVDVRLRAGRAFRPLIAHVIVQMVSEGECA